MGKYRVRNKYSKACKKVKNIGHFKTSFGGKHIRVTAGTKGIHPSIRFGKVTFKPRSGNYSIRGKRGTYYGNTKRKSSRGHYGLLTLGLSFEDWLKAMGIAAIGFFLILIQCCYTSRGNDEWTRNINRTINCIIYGKGDIESIEQLVEERKEELNFYDRKYANQIKIVATCDIDCVEEGTKCIEAGEEYIIENILGNVKYPDTIFYEIKDADYTYASPCDYHYKLIMPENYFEVVE